jgi:hypothetical protein
MSVIDRIQNASGIVKGILGLLALSPGIALFVGLVEIPSSVAKIVYLLSFFVSVLAILSIILLTDWVDRLSSAAAVIVAAVSLMVGATGLIAYMQYATDHIIPITDDNGNDVKYLMPDLPSGPLLGLVRHRNPGHPTISEYQRALQLSGQRGELKRMIGAETLKVMLLMLLLLIGAEVLLITPLVALAWKLAGPGPKPAAAT